MSVLTEKHLAKASTNHRVILLTHTDRRTCMKTVSTAQPLIQRGYLYYQWCRYRSRTFHLIYRHQAWW